MKIPAYIIICLCFFAKNTLQAQQADSSNKIQFKLGLFYNSNLNYYGRTDSLQSSGVFPAAEIWFSNKFYISGAPVFVNNSAGNFQYAGTVITAGYMAKSKNEKFLTRFSVIKPVYTAESQLVQSALKGQAGFGITWLNNIVNLSAGSDIKLSDRLDYGFSAGLDHLFRKELPGAFILVLNPSFNAYAGTQQFTKTYYKKSRFLFLPASEQVVTEQATRVNILSYECSMPVVLAKNKVQFILNPAYVIPQNLLAVEGRPDLSERGKNLFSITIGAKINF